MSSQYIAPIEEEDDKVVKSEFCYYVEMRKLSGTLQVYAYMRTNSVSALTRHENIQHCIEYQTSQSQSSVKKV